MLQAYQINGENRYYACKVQRCVSLVIYLEGIFILPKEEINNEFSS